MKETTKLIMAKVIEEGLAGRAANLVTDTASAGYDHVARNKGKYALATGAGATAGYHGLLGRDIGTNMQQAVANGVTNIKQTYGYGPSEELQDHRNDVVDYLQAENYKQFKPAGIINQGEMNQRIGGDAGSNLTDHIPVPENITNIDANLGVNALQSFVYEGEDPTLGFFDIQSDIIQESRESCCSCCAVGKPCSGGNTEVIEEGSKGDRDHISKLGKSGNTKNGDAPVDGKKKAEEYLDKKAKEKQEAKDNSDKKKQAIKDGAKAGAQSIKDAATKTADKAKEVYNKSSEQTKNVVKAGAVASAGLGTVAAVTKDDKSGTSDTQSIEESTGPGARVRFNMKEALGVILESGDTIEFLNNATKDQLLEQGYWKTKSGGILYYTRLTGEDKEAYEKAKADFDNKPGK